MQKAQCADIYASPNPSRSALVLGLRYGGKKATR